MLRVIVIRPGATDFDDQGRIRGTLDIPLNDGGQRQVARAARELVDVRFDCIYTSPGQPALQTAEALAQRWGVKVKTLKNLRNLDHGLWHGKLVEEVKRLQPKVYRQWQEHPRKICPPGGETVEAARQRVGKSLTKVLKKHNEGVIGLVISEPLASIAESLLDHRELGDLWQSKRGCGSWELIELDSADVACSQ